MEINIVNQISKSFPAAIQIRVYPALRPLRPRGKAKRLKKKQTNKYNIFFRVALRWQLARILALNLVNLYTLMLSLFSRVEQMASGLKKF